MKKNISLKLMVMAMSFFILIPKSFSQEKENQNTNGSREVQKHGVGIGLGETFLLGKFEDQGDHKVGLYDLYYTYVASYSFDLLVNLHKSIHRYKKKEVDLEGYTMSIKGRYFEFDQFSPFLMGGLGFYKPVVDNGSKRSKAKNTFGMNFGAGLDLRLNDNIVIGVLGHFHKPFDVKQEEMTNVRGYYFKLLLTAMYLF